MAAGPSRSPTAPSGNFYRRIPGKDGQPGPAQAAAPSRCRPGSAAARGGRSAVPGGAPALHRPLRGPGQPSSAPLGPAAVPAPAEAQPGRPGGRQVLVPAPPPPARPQRPPPRTGCSRRGGRGSRCCCCRCRRGSAAAVAYGSLPAGMPAHRWHNPRRGRAGRGQLLARRRCRGAGTAEAGGRRGGQAAAAAGEEGAGKTKSPAPALPLPCRGTAGRADLSARRASRAPRTGSTGSRHFLPRAAPRALSRAGGAGAPPSGRAEGRGQRDRPAVRGRKSGERTGKERKNGWCGDPRARTAFLRSPPLAGLARCR
uniref:uncharacterized protein C10orf95-like n=1 Tax=Lonchura striata TaxID=40157 RepID=UPI000B4C7EE4|nr:uncharacterized protein C10orf95-like [Lonchura striata domestica]